ncbi:hypothetical protein BDF20DRAFT_868844 [Mycotypha africana]|uniref:uncharacterized protein n=1 Tax=Mycotypha africana TaxID=64632 RepID=UPI002300E9A5|nr:uncharacterized protein BDF20DRAFT_868844 [Mycotypha africana]KAI8979312.1 hypothetical protein BDF20DRAFT_868844 [Mycotypha africana]
MDIVELSDALGNLTTFSGDAPKQHPAPTLSWVNVAVASSFILVNCLISFALGLQLEKTLVIAAIRCLVQLTLMGFILEDVFNTRHPALVLLMTFVLIILGAYETVYNKSKQTYKGMFISVLISSGVATTVIGIIGTRYAMKQVPFWIPEIFIPTMGMLLGNAMSGMAVALSSCLSSVSNRKEQIETYLAFGASRWEAGQSIAIEAVRMSMLPTINQMSVIGLIAIPGMMTGQILGGAPVSNAVKYQQIIMFLISASTALGVLSCVVSCIRVVIDSKHRLRPEKIISGRASLLKDIKQALIDTWNFICCMKIKRKKADTLASDEDDNENESQREPLLGD